LLSIQTVSAQYGHARVLNDVSFEVDEGQLLAVVGANGAGKTTLVKAISGVVPVTRGRIVFNGEDLTGLRPDQIVLKGIVHVPEGRRLFGDMTVLENLLLGSTHAGARPQRAQTLERVFGLFPILKERQAQVASTMSGGQQQMVAIARGLMGRPRVLILDEPSLGIAPLIVSEIFEVIRKLNQEGLTVLLIEQNLRQALSIAHRGIVLENGKVVLSDTGAALLNNQHTRKAYLGL
jgi:branched-chain amino acid transport system ATP-binding protein